MLPMTSIHRRTLNLLLVEIFKSVRKLYKFIEIMWGTFIMKQAVYGIRKGTKLDNPFGRTTAAIFFFDFRAALA